MKIIIRTNLVDRMPKMLYTKFQGSMFLGSGEEEISKGFYHISAWRPSWSYDRDFTNKITLPHLIAAPHAIWFQSAP